MSRHLTTLLFAALPLALPVLPASANVLVVDAAGSGAFTQISAAVAAASDGDVILVKSGTYGGFAIANKSLDIVADIGASVQIQGNVDVTALGAARTVTLTALGIRATSMTPGLRLLSNSGSIRVQGCTIEGFDQPDCITPFSNGGHGVELFDSADVAFAGCTLHGGDAPDFSGFVAAADGGRALTGTSSNVALFECALVGGAGSSFSFGTCPNLGCCTYAGDGGDGAHLVSSPLAFFSSSSVAGGRFGTAEVDGYHGCGGSGLFLQPAGAAPPSHARALQSSFQQGFGSFGCATLHGDVVAPAPNTFLALVGASRRISATRLVREQQPARVDFFGQPGDQVLLTVAEAGRFVYVEPQRGVRLLRTRTPTPVQIVGTIGASGTLSSAWIVPDLGAGVQARRFLLQAQFIDASGQATLGPPSTMVLVDSAF